MNLSELELTTRCWARDRNLIKGTTSEKQFIKTVEELGEVAACLAKDNQHELELEIGDVLVCLTILCAQKGTDLEVCFGAAWNKIKDRKGRMIDGYFVKESDF